MSIPPDQPRDRATRVADTLRRLETDIDLWVATSDETGPYLVPLSFAWAGSTLVIATGATSRTARNLLADGRVRVALGPTRDVVMVDGTVRAWEVADIAADAADAFTRTGFDPRTLSTHYLYFEITPVVVRAWREENELADRVIMRESRWLG